MRKSSLKRMIRLWLLSTKSIDRYALNANCFMAFMVIIILILTLYNALKFNASVSNLLRLLLYIRNTNALIQFINIHSKFLLFQLLCGKRVIALFTNISPTVTRQPYITPPSYPKNSRLFVDKKTRSKNNSASSVNNCNINNPNHPSYSGNLLSRHQLQQDIHLKESSQSENEEGPQEPQHDIQNNDNLTTPSH